MKVSKFNYEFEHRSKRYVYNCLTDALFSFTHPFGNEYLENFTDDEIERLVCNGLVVKGNYEDELTNLFLETKKQDGEDVKYNHVVIAPSLLCNARCFYCYEESSKPSTMTEEVIEKTVEFIRQNADRSKPFGISWFGGEPTLFIGIIEKISRALMGEYHFSASMISNGSRLTKENVLTLGACKVKHVQLSIDGFGEVYSCRKKYADSTTFEDVVKGIENCIDSGISVALRLNIDQDNVQSICELIDFLTQRIHSPLLSAYPAPLYGASVLNQLSQDLELINSVITDIMARLKKCNMLDRKCELNSGILKYPCMAHADNSIVIDPDGFLYKCEHDVGRPEVSVGSVFTGRKQAHSDEVIPLNTKFADCYVCPLLPKCLGGCDAVRRDGELPCGILKQTLEHHILSKIGE